jgi:hypothetical protein
MRFPFPPSHPPDTLHIHQPRLHNPRGNAKRQNPRIPLRHLPRPKHVCQLALPVAQPPAQHGHLVHRLELVEDGPAASACGGARDEAHVGVGGGGGALKERRSLSIRSAWPR